MDFKIATSLLTDCVSYDEIAEAAGRSVQSIRQARLARTSTGYRQPPSGWPEIVVRLARRRARELTKLADEIEQGSLR